MTRNEMIQKMLDRLKEFRHQDIHEFSVIYNITNALLDECEKNGMLPPSKKMTYHEMEAVRQYVRDFHSYMHSWEPEATSKDLDDSLNKLINEEGWDDVEAHADGVKSARK